MTWLILNEMEHGKTFIITCMPIKVQDQPAHSLSWIKVFHGHCKGNQGPKALLCRQQGWSDCMYVQAVLSLQWVHMTFCRFCFALAQIRIKLPRIIKVVTMTYCFIIIFHTLYFQAAISLFTQAQALISNNKKVMSCKKALSANVNRKDSYSNSEDLDEPAHLNSLARIFIFR